jgi:5-formyltetrahydrofolate cyclo-ligase
MMEIDLKKRELREVVKTKLAAMTSLEYIEYNAAIYQCFMELYKVRRAASIMIYHSIGNEVETVSIIQRLLTMGKMVSLPVCMPSRNLVAGLVNDMNQLVTTRYGLKEPDPLKLQSPEFIDIIVVPGLAFDLCGYRLGRGAGYYDRFLRGYPDTLKIGLAYDLQVSPRIPVESHDVRLDGLVTPGGYKEFTE